LWPVRPFVLERQVISAADVDGGNRARQGVESGCEDDGVQSDRFVGGVDAGFRDFLDRMLAYVDEPHMRQVVSGVVIRVQARTFRPERVIGRAQIRGGLWIVDERPDLVAEELGELLIGRRIAQGVGEDVERLEQ
jgi:hypothetical protein